MERRIRNYFEPPENPSEKRRVGKKAKKEKKKTFQLKYVVIVSILFFIIQDSFYLWGEGPWGSNPRPSCIFK